MNKRERYFANLLTKQNRIWEYPTKKFSLKNSYYCPDFYLPKENLYIEVGTRQAYYLDRKKIEEFKKLYPYIHFKMYIYTGEEFKGIGLNKILDPRVHMLNLNEQEELEFQIARSKFSIKEILYKGLTYCLKQCPKPSREAIKKLKNLVK